VPYDLRTDLVGVFGRHADGCPARHAAPCSCGPLGYRAGIWDWQATRWVISPLLPTTEQAQDWQRAANQLVESAGSPAPPPPTPRPESQGDTAKASERFFWWIFCYVGLAFLGVGLALFASDVAG
jgi:hypothetical protein